MMRKGIAKHEVEKEEIRVAMEDGPNGEKK